MKNSKYRIFFILNIIALILAFQFSFAHEYYTDHSHDSDIDRKIRGYLDQAKDDFAYGVTGSTYNSKCEAVYSITTKVTGGCAVYNVNSYNVPYVRACAKLRHEVTAKAYGADDDGNVHNKSIVRAYPEDECSSFYERTDSFVGKIALDECNDQISKIKDFFDNYKPNVGNGYCK